MRRSALLLAAALLAAPPGRAALVVLEEGRHLKVTAFELVGEERIRVTLRGGGEMVLPIERVERIVDDEIDPDDFAPKATPPLAGVPKRSVRGSGGRPHGAPERWSSLVESAAAAHRLDPALVAAVIRVESNWQPRAVSPKGARGLMQLMPATARRLGVTKAFDPAQNVGGGVRYLSLLADRFGEHEVEKVLAAYNAGEGAVEQYEGVPPYRETREYVRKVLAIWEGVRAGS